MNPINVLRLALIAVTAVYGVVWGRAMKAMQDLRFPSPFQLFVGYATNFLDTLGIGSFATTTTTYRLTRNVDDRVIPGTLNVGHTLPTTVQALIYTTLIEVDVTTLFSMIAASILGSWLGAGVVARWSKLNVQIGMGVALLVAATIFFMQQLALFPSGGADIGVTGVRLVIAVVVNFVLGALMTLGIGLYAPCMILVSLLGMNPTAAFPIMMGSCAFLMPVGSLRFIQENSYSPRAALGLAIGGIPAVLLAAYIVKSLPLYYVRWLVIVVVVYTSVSMLWSAYRSVSAGSILEPRRAGM
ncbi:MAG TPA: sulfite exporter TauE/SafE family protein [Terriglobia bacterium]|nr:sulfite exporter TauE/SafE family protein [Terriglobia bacterium]